MKRANGTYKRFPKTDLAFAVTDDGRKATVSYGGSLGSREFPGIVSAAIGTLPWLEERRKLLIAQAAEIAQVERYLKRFL